MTGLKTLPFLISILTVVTADTEKIQFNLNGNIYQRIDIQMTWSGAVEYCRKLGGHLVTITSGEENEFIYKHFGIDGVNIWIGATDESVEGNWQWITGEPFVYNNWATRMPDDVSQGQDYAIFWDLDPGRWDDNGLPLSNASNIFICEWEPIF